jgi:hypothetical protein
MLFQRGVSAYLEALFEPGNQSLYLCLHHIKTHVLAGSKIDPLVSEKRLDRIS